MNKLYSLKRIIPISVLSGSIEKIKFTRAKKIIIPKRGEQKKRQGNCWSERAQKKITKISVKYNVGAKKSMRSPETVANAGQKCFPSCTGRSNNISKKRVWEGLLARLDHQDAILALTH